MLKAASPGPELSSSQFNGSYNGRCKNVRRHSASVEMPGLRRSQRRTWKISWTTFQNRNAGMSRPAICWNAQGFRCPSRIPRNEIRRSAWRENKPFSLNLKARVSRDVVDGPDSSEPKPRRWCLQKEISKSVIRHDRRKTPRSLCLDDGSLHFHVVDNSSICPA